MSTYLLWNFSFIRNFEFPFCPFFTRERYQKNSWLTPIPDSHKLTEDDITEFVESIMPCVILAMFSKVGCSDAAAAFRYLAKVRPELVIPALLDRCIFETEYTYYF